MVPTEHHKQYDTIAPGVKLAVVATAVGMPHLRGCVRPGATVLGQPLTWHDELGQPKVRNLRDMEGHSTVVVSRP